MSRAISGATRLACVLGHPVAHSLSPAIHNAAFQAAGLDWAYVAFDVEPALLPQAIAGLRALGVGGANLTMPHKQAVLPLLDAVDADAGRIGAVNTIVNRDGSLVGSNTDGAGFLGFLAGEEIHPAGCRVLLLGAGGAARAIASSLGSAGASVVVAARTPAAAREVAALAGTDGGACAWDQRGAQAAGAAIIV
ncbi:MAG: shikimate dehydrogenase family protein, partial [Actinomycetota bacterium]